MSDYLESLGPNATLGIVFSDLYERVNDTIQQLDVLRLEDRVANSTAKDIPGTDLEFEWLAVSGGHRDSHSTTILTAIHAGGRSRLVGRIKHLIPPQWAPRPEGVMAFSEINSATPDYKLTHEPSGLITCRLGRLGIIGNRGQARRSLIGVTTGQMSDSLGRLYLPARERLDMVAASILANLDVAESIALGMKATEALATPAR